MIDHFELLRRNKKTSHGLKYEKKFDNKKKEMKINFVKGSNLPYIGEKNPLEIDSEKYSVGYYIAKTWCKEDINNLVKIETRNFIKKYIINFTNCYMISLYANYYYSNIHSRIDFYNLTRKKLIRICDDLKIKSDYLIRKKEEEKTKYIKCITDTYVSKTVKKK